ncbi:hypothetical protein DAT35_57320 [Vitiosangium sp. GDMCC 1.1324]|nr:hypothetical protein DAT35_57320 [Vitiosangium sp. GDMCC 1.1324]
MRDFRMRVEDRWTQWSLEAATATVHVEIAPLFTRSFHARRVDADGVKFRLRTRHTPEELAQLPANSFPPIPGLGPQPLREDDRFPFDPPLEHPWTVAMNDVHASATEIWVDGERFEGASSATGRFGMRFDRHVEVGSAALEFTDGTLEHRGSKIAQALTGRLEASLDRFNPREVRDAAVLDQLSVKGRLRGASPEVDAGSVSTGCPSFKADLAMVRGVLAEGTALTARVPDIESEFGPIAVRGQAEVSFQVKGDEQMDWSLRARNVRATARRFGSLSVVAMAATVTAKSKGTRVRTLGLPTKAKLDLPSARVRDLRALNALSPEPLGIEVLSGSGVLSAHLQVNAQDRIASGSIHLETSKLSVKHEDRTMHGVVTADVRIEKVDGKLQRMTVGKTQLAFSQMVIEKAQVANAPWSGAIVLPGGTVDAHRKEIFRGKVQARFDNAKPLFRAMVDELPVPRIVKGLITPNNVTASADVSLGRSLVEMRNLQARVGRADVRGNATMAKKSLRTVAEVSLGSKRMGIVKDGESTHVKLLAGRDWYDRALTTQS